MRYSYEFKRKCVDLYRKGIYPDTPDGVTSESYKSMIREWVRRENAQGPEVLKHKDKTRFGYQMKN